MTNPRPFHILALSGGGFRGLFTAQIIADLEEMIGEPIARRFDLIVGTSIGGILALALSLEIPARVLVDAFKEHGPRIFPSPWGAGFLQLLSTFRLPPLQRISLSSYWASTYPSTELATMLMREDLLGARIVGDASHPVIVPTVNYTTGMPQMFKTPHNANLWKDWKLRMVDVALATSAAPLYFPRHTIEGCQYVDGGLYCNAPGLIAFHEAVHFFDADPNAVSLLAIGTMSTKLTADPSQNRRGGMLGWGGKNPANTSKKLFSLAISAQESDTDFMLGHWLGERYFHIDETLTGDKALAVGLDKASPGAIEALVGSATQASKVAIGVPAFRDFMGHHAAPAIFHHGPHKTLLEPQK